MWKRLAAGIVKTKNCSCLREQPSGLWRIRNSLVIPPSIHGISTYRFFSTSGKNNGNGIRNVTAFQPFLNDFIAQYSMTKDKHSILERLEKNSEKYGFSVLTQAVNKLLLDNSEMNQINLYSMLVIASIQVKDDKLLTYVLADVNQYISSDSHCIYEVLKRICHYRKYSHFITFLQDYFNNYPEAMQFIPLCEMGLYLASRDTNDNRTFAISMWEQINMTSASTEEETHQRSTDLSHLLTVLSRHNDWASCSLFIRSPCSSIKHVTQLLRSMVHASAKPGFIVLSYLDYRSVIYQKLDETTMKDALYIIDLMLDVFKLSNDLNLLSVLVEDITSSPQLQVPNELYSRLCKVCLHNQLTSPLFKLYCLNGGKYPAKVYRSVERYFNKLTGDNALNEMKNKVFEYHYSNIGDTNMEKETIELEEEDFIEEDVLRILQSDFQVKRVPREEKKKQREVPKKRFRKRMNFSFCVSILSNVENN